MKSTLRPIIMVAFVFLMMFLIQQHLGEREELKEQQKEIDPASVIYSDQGSSDNLKEGVTKEEAKSEVESIQGGKVVEE